MMQDSLFSPLWYRYSQLKPKLKPQIKVQAQQYRNQQWYILNNQANDTQVRVNQAAYAIIGRCEGKFTVQQVWQAVLDLHTEDAPTQSEVIHLLNELDQKEYLVYDTVPDMPNMFRRSKRKSTDRRNAFINPFAFRIPLWNPSNYLKKLTLLPTLIFNHYTLFIWLTLMVLGLAILLTQWSELFTHAKTYMLTARYILIAWVCFPLVKTLHELSHAMAVRFFGGDVKEVGLTLFMLTPAPYVDASEANFFKSRKQRAIVSAIGIMTELLLAAIAILVYVNTQPGYVKDVAFVIAFMCSVSTLLFNGNPLLRFDAYYVMCDIFSLPNLASRSRAYWTNLISSIVVGKKHSMPMTLAQGEKKWLMLYSPLSTAYSLFIFFSLVLWLGGKSVLLGLSVLAYVLIGMIARPLYGLIKNIVMASPVGIPRLKTKIVIYAALGSILAMLLFWPLPYSTSAQGIIWVPDQAQVRADIEGNIVKILVKENEKVAEGQTLILLENPDLFSEKESLNSQLTKLEVDQFNAMFNNPEQSKAIEEQINKIKAERNQIDKKISKLQIKSTENGRFVMPYQQDKENGYAKKGDVLAYVLDESKVNVRVALDAEKVAVVQHQLETVEVRSADHLSEVMAANIVMITPSVTDKLPSKTLGEQGGGPYVTDPSDKEGLKLLKPIVLVDLNVPNASLVRAGGRVFVRFNHGSEPIASQLYYTLKQLFLSRFNADS